VRVSPSDLAARIRDVPDFPKKGIVFKDITPVLRSGPVFRQAIEQLADEVKDLKVDAVVGIESRGFIFAAPLAYLLGVGFVPIRKLGRLPAGTTSIEYQLEYGTNSLEMHVDALEQGNTVLIVDDLLATGGTVAATIELVERLGGIVEAVAFLVELTFLKGRQRLEGRRVISLVKY
jgi:adenine phosphoribosyltransferase